jgi:putative membrane protein
MKYAHISMITLKAILIIVTFLGTSVFHKNGVVVNGGQLAQSLLDDVTNDSQFLVRAAEINMEEVLLGQLAQQKSMVKEIIELGQMIEEAHTQSMGTLTELAKNKKITIPTMPKHSIREAYKKLNAKSESEFNKAYCDMMVDGHVDAIITFEKALKSIADEDIKEWATAAIPVLRNHLDRSRVCQKTVEAINGNINEK